MNASYPQGRLTDEAIKRLLDLGIPQEMIDAVQEGNDLPLPPDPTHQLNARGIATLAELSVPDDIIENAVFDSRTGEYSGIEPTYLHEQREEAVRVLKRREEQKLAAQKYREDHQNDPTFRAKSADATNRYREEHKDDPKFRARVAADAKRHRERVKGDTERAATERQQAAERMRRYRARKKQGYNPAAEDV